MRQIKITKAITARNSESLDRYLAEIAREPMLTPEEEASLAQKIHLGGKEGLKARDRLVNSNLRFVVSVANQYQHQGISLVDLINEGNIGLVKAAEKFDETRGFKFISYAVWWIRQNNMEALGVKSRIIHVPMNQMGVALKVNRATEAFLQKTGRMPSVHEISVETGLDEDVIESAKDANNRPTSIDAPLGDDTSDNTIGEMLTSDDNTFISDKSVDNASLNKFIEDLLKEVLTDREQVIVKASFGIGSPEKSLEELAGDMGMTRERIRQVKEKAIRKIRHSPAAKILKQYLG